MNFSRNGSETLLSDILLKGKGQSGINVTCCNCDNVTSSMQHGQTDFDAFLYIIVVLSFYAISMVLLMVKYIRREEEEISLDHYYTEFVEREHFQNIRNRNKLLVQRVVKDSRVEKLLEDDKEIERFAYSQSNCDISIQVFSNSRNNLTSEAEEGRNLTPSRDSDRPCSVTSDIKVVLETDL